MQVDPYVYGLLYATLGGHVFIKPVVSSMWDFLAIKHTELKEGKGRYSSQPTILGIVERSLYYVSFLFNFPVFVGVWLTLKTVAKSPRWANEDNKDQKRKSNPKPPPGRALFQPFLVGNGLSILFGVAGYAITLVQTDLDYLGNSFLLAVTIGPAAISLILYGLSLAALAQIRKNFWKDFGKLLLKHFVGYEFRDRPKRTKHTR